MEQTIDTCINFAGRLTNYVAELAGRGQGQGHALSPTYVEGKIPRVRG